jgi:hypothetical protein
MKKTQKTNLHALISDAWDFLWARNMADRAAGRDFRGDTYYLTASDIERQARHFLSFDLKGKPRPKLGDDDADGTFYGLNQVRVSTGSPHVTFLGMVRRWLQSNRKLEAFNFGRGHISGARYRPVGSEMYKSEKKAIAKAKLPRKPRPVHAPASGDGGHGAPLLCRATRPKGRFTFRFNRSLTRVSYKGSTPVTCPLCLKLLGNNVTAKTA